MKKYLVILIILLIVYNIFRYCIHTEFTNLIKKKEEFTTTPNNSNRIITETSNDVNINNAIKHASRDIIKILFQDDFLYDEHSLEKQLECFKSDWMVTACCHYNGKEIYKPYYPKYHNNIQYGENTISSPSVLMFKNKNILEFDENLFWLMDVDYYKRLYNMFGSPSICSYITVVNREHENQVSNTLATEEIKKQELEYIIKKYANI
jgi:hypothetical protein